MIYKLQNKQKFNNSKSENSSTNRILGKCTGRIYIFLNIVIVRIITFVTKKWSLNCVSSLYSDREKFAMQLEISVLTDISSENSYYIWWDRTEWLGKDLCCSLCHMMFEILTTFTPLYNANCQLKMQISTPAAGRFSF